MEKLVIPTFEDIVYNLCKPENEEYIKDTINLLIEHGLLQNIEKSVLDTYQKIYKTTNTVPSIGLLQQTLPQFKCIGAKDLEALKESTQLFIKDRINKNVSNQILLLADKVSHEGITEEVADKLSSLTQSDANTKSYTPIENKIDEIFHRTISKSGIRLDTRKIDDYIGGLKPGQLSTIAAFTGGGKSTFAVCAMHSAMKQGFNVCYLSLELSADHLYYNLISRHSVELGPDGYPKFRKPIEHARLKNKTCDNGDWEYIMSDIIPDLKALPGKCYILDEQDLEARTFFAFDNKLQEIEKLALEDTGHGIDLLIVDHIQMLQYSESTARQSENTIINKWVDYFRSNCLNFLKTKRQIHTLMCAQINRQGYMRAKKNNGLYDLTALKEANEIETASAIIISLYSDEALSKGKEIKFGILKNRDGIKSDIADTIYCDFEHQLIGGDSITSDQQFASMSMDDLMAIGKPDEQIQNIGMQGSLFADDDIGLPF